MSRQIRKMRRNQELQLQLQHRSDESESDGPVLAKPRTSLFAALGGQADGDDGNDENNDDDDDSPAEATPIPAASQEEAGVTKKKKKKKKKKAKITTTAQPEQQQQETHTSAGRESEDEIDRALRALNIEPPAATAAAAADDDDDVLDRLLSINPHHLRPLNEIKGYFGSQAVEAVQAEEREDREAALHAATRHRGEEQNFNIEMFLRASPGERLPELSLRKNVFVQGLKHWPRASSEGLSMAAEGTLPDGTRQYRWMWDGTYEGVQAAFFHYVLMGEPTNIIHMVHQHPYHIASLIQASSIAKQENNTSLATELYERALFSFGRITTSAFRKDLETGKARVQFERPENRQFWTTAYLYIKTLIQKGTYRTALEWAKLLLSLDRSDPYCLSQVIPMLALRSGEAGWLAEYLPYSLLDVYAMQAFPLALLQIGNRDAARIRLEDGVTRLPWLFSSLFRALQLDAPPSVWGFQPQDNQQFWTKLYIRQTKDVWAASPDAIRLLKEVAGSAPRPAEPRPTENTNPAYIMYNYPIELNTARFAYLEQDGSLIEHVPRHFFAHQPNYEFDPLPPSEDDNIFSYPAGRMPWLHARATDGALADPVPDPARPESDTEDDRVFRQFLARDGQQIIDQHRAMGGEPPYPEEQGDDPHGATGFTIAERLGLHHWIMNHLEQLAPLAGLARGGGDQQDQQDDQDQHEDQDQHDHQEYNDHQDHQEQQDQSDQQGQQEQHGEERPPSGPMPGAWPRED